MAATMGGLDWFIESQIFFPEKGLVQTPAALGLSYRDVWLRSEDGVRLHSWLVEGPPGGPLVLFLHGNAGNISHRVENLGLLHELGLSVLILDYRGYGQSQGSISEQGLYADCLAAYHQAAELSAQSGRRLVIFGRSLGGVGAVFLASSQPCHGLILESTFTNLGDMAKVHFPIPGMGGWLAKRFDSQGRIPLVRAPILFFHGDRDDIVPQPLGRALYEAATTSKQWVTLRGAGHNDTIFVNLPEYMGYWRGFLQTLPAQPLGPGPAGP
jgi:hypothetical protein